MVVPSLMINSLCFAFFFLDLFAAIMYQQWVVNLLLLLFVLVRNYEFDDAISQHPMLAICFFLMLEDWFLTGWSAVGLLYLIPLYFLCEQAYFVLRLNKVVIQVLLVTLGVLARNWLFVGLSQFGIHMFIKTFCQICITLVVGYTIFWNVLGNRLLSVIKR